MALELQARRSTGSEGGSASHRLSSQSLRRLQVASMPP